MVTSEKHQKSLLGGIERLAGVDHPDLISVIPKILMEFYQAEVLEEDVVMSWGTHISKKYVDKETSKKVRKASEPFLKVKLTLEAVLFLLIVMYSGSRRLMTMMMMMRVERFCVFERWWFWVVLGGFGFVSYYGVYSYTVIGLCMRTLAKLQSAMCL